MHVYVHVPFCRRRCSYCDFSIAVRRTVPAAEYVDLILAELVARQAELAGGQERERGGGASPAELGSRRVSDGGGGASPAEPGVAAGASATPAIANPPNAAGATALRDVPTLYLGGGTPSLLDAAQLARLVAGIAERMARAAAPPDEITLEANPEDVTPRTAAAWRAAGVNRVSLGAQSFDDRVLLWMHRLHSAERTGRAVRSLRGAGFDNVSLDLIFALPPELERDWAQDLDRALALEPDHLSLYGLTVEERTPLARWVSRGATHTADDERYAAEYLLAHERLAAAGVEFYEVSNAARAGRESRHNSAYWTLAPYVGLGPAAHSFDGATRSWNLSAWEAYRRAAAAGRACSEGEERLSAEQRALERVYLALRTRDGLPVRDVPPEVAAAWRAHGWAADHGDRLRLTPEGWLRLDTLAPALTGAARAS